MAIRVLCAGDIHIGRRSSRVRDVFRSADAWRDVVDIAIQLQVDLVALSGDIIDQESKSYEALGPMQHGLSRLYEAGIATVAVAGNHDFDVLARLTSITGTGKFHLLGQGGKWERFTLTREGHPLLHIDGWSFPNEHVRQAPLDSYTDRPADGIPVMALLHGDIGNNNSSYAPVNIQELWAKPFAFTLLGHIHKPQIFDGFQGKRALYPGSPYALDPGEPGIHGCWVAEIGEDGSTSLQQHAISPVQYVTGEVDIDEIIDESGFQARLSEALRTLAEETAQEYGSNALKIVSARLTCTGSSSAHRLVDGWIAQAFTDLGQFPVGSVHVEVDKFSSSVRPHIDLHERARGNDPVAEAAKILLALQEESPPDPYGELINSTLCEMQKIYRHTGYATLRSADQDAEPRTHHARELVGQRTWEMISLLVAQEELT